MIKGKVKYSNRFLNIISPFMGIKGIAIFPYIVLKEIYNTKWINEREKKRLINHEQIHIRQELELMPFSILLNSILIVILSGNYWLLLLSVLPFINCSLFYLIYIIEFIFKGYRGISFEREAFTNDDNLEYLNNRKFFAFTNHFNR